VYDHSGNYIYTVVIKRDITGLIEKQEKLQELLDINADQTQRLQNFTHIVSHNIRSHSANLSALLELMESSPSSSEQQDYLPHLKKTTDRLEETIQNLNEVISINNHLNQAKQKLPLRVEIEKILELLQPQIQEAQASIQLRVAEDLHVLAVPAYLESILQNLISNALKYRALHRQAFVEIQAFETKTGVWVYVQDNGMGIDLKSNRDKIFGMYKTFHTNEDARGLGLFITKNQVEAMGGRIDVESVPGIGTTFKVMFADD
jgi:signal transduction histidine kinase